MRRRGGREQSLLLTPWRKRHKRGERRKGHIAIQSFPDTTMSIARGDTKYVEEEEENNPCYQHHGGKGASEEREGRGVLLYNLTVGREKKCTRFLEKKRNFGF